MTTIGPSLVIAGELTSDEDVLVRGRVLGHVIVRNATLTVAERAEVEADVRGGRVLVQGRIKGGVTAGERIELAASAQVDGNLSANRVVLQEGAAFNGRIDMGQRTIAARVASYKASQDTK